MLLARLGDGRERGADGGRPLTAGGQVVDGARSDGNARPAGAAAHAWGSRLKGRFAGQHSGCSRRRVGNDRRGLERANGRCRRGQTAVGHQRLEPARLSANRRRSDDPRRGVPERGGSAEVVDEEEHGKARQDGGEAHAGLRSCWQSRRWERVGTVASAARASKVRRKKRGLQKFERAKIKNEQHKRATTKHSLSAFFLRARD